MLGLEIDCSDVGGDFVSGEELCCFDLMLVLFIVFGVVVIFLIFVFFCFVECSCWIVCFCCGDLVVVWVEFCDILIDLCIFVLDVDILRVCVVGLVWDFGVDLWVLWWLIDVVE